MATESKTKDKKREHIMVIQPPVLNYRHFKMNAPRFLLLLFLVLPLKNKTTSNESKIKIQIALTRSHFPYIYMC